MKKIFCLYMFVMAGFMAFAASENVLTPMSPNGVYVTVGDTVPFYVPNAFTPNCDGTNEYFLLKYELTPEETFSTFFMMICDRYGNVLFKTYNPNAYWDGKDKNGALCPAGVYTYVIKYKLRNRTKAETVSKDALEVKTGNVVLIR